MRILILSNNYSAKSFYDLFSKDKNNIVFSVIENCNYTEINDSKDALEFCLANEINLVLITDKKYILDSYHETLNNEGISVFCPSKESSEICHFKSLAKKFMHKNKIPTPKFFTAEKPQAALDYIADFQNPMAIKPDYNSFQEGTKFFETKSQAQKLIEERFFCGNKKIILEDYIEGKSFTTYTLSNGFSAKIIGNIAKYQNDIALFEPKFITNEIKQKIYDEIIMKTLTNLSAQNEEYIGILGFDFILSYDGKLYCLGFKSFFDDIDVDFFTKGYDINWLDVFDSTIVGDVFEKYDFKINTDKMLCLRQNEEINFISSLTQNSLEMKLSELGYDLKEYIEAKKAWKY